MFKDDVQLAIIGEFAVWGALMDFKGIKTVFDVRKDKTFQEWDVDFLVMDSNQQISWVEVKTDWVTHKTGNIFYEFESFGKVGCLEKTKANVIAYFVPQSGNIYLLDTKALRRCVHTYNYPVKTLENSKGYLVPIGDLERFSVQIRRIETTPLAIERKTTDEYTRDM